MLLLFADDMIQGSDTVGRLQKLINTLEIFCDNWGLSVNMETNKIIVFRNGGVLKRNEKWYYRGKQI